MRPDDPNNRRLGTPLVPERQLLRPSGAVPRQNTTDAAANIVRGQINRIYTNEAAQPPLQTQADISSNSAAQDVTSPYKQTHTDTHTIQADQWKQYHSAWQDYYKQYYERYYMHQVHAAKQQLHATMPAEETDAAADEPLSKEEAMYELRSSLVNKIKASAATVRKSRHFIPIAAALSVMLVFIFLQYNRVIFANVEAYVSPGNINPANIIVDPVTEAPVSPEPKLIIPKINVDVPVDFNALPDQASQLKAMETGVAWFGIPGANSKPGQIGNTVIAGHSSNDIVDTGAYKFIFARLEQLTVGDTVYINYQGKRYAYTITKTEVVKPTEVNRLVYATDKPILTLITCTPLGTALKRLLVTAEQISPDPKAAVKAPESSSDSTSVSMPGNSPTFIQRLFGATEG